MTLENNSSEICYASTFTDFKDVQRLVLIFDVYQYSYREKDFGFFY